MSVTLDPMNLPRRKFCTVLAGFLGSACLRGASSALRTRNYRIDVTIALLGVPIFSRQNVGNGLLSLDESDEGGRRTVSLSFAGGSKPERAHGILYAGSSEERVVELDSQVLEAKYFGFVTSSKNESFEEARRRVMVENPNGSAFVAVEAAHRAGCVRNSQALLAFPQGAWSDWRDLLAKVRLQFPTASLLTKEVPFPGALAPSTFLYSVLRAARAPENRSCWQYVHNAKLYRLECERSHDPHMGATLASRQLTDSAGRVVRMGGRIFDPSTKSSSAFRCWMEEGSDLPLRIEFQPRPYVRISLEKEGA